MKKTTILTLVTTVIIVASCGNKVQNSDHQQDSLSADSIATEVPVQKTVEFYSDDLKKCGLLGHVKSVSKIETPSSENSDIQYAWVRCNVDKLKFDRNGKKVDGDYIDPTKKEEVDDNGFLVKCYSRESDATEYNRTLKDLNQNGWPQQEFVSVVGPVDDYHCTYSYEYIKTDKYGNWVERKVASEGIEFTDGNWIERRVSSDRPEIIDESIDGRKNNANKTKASWSETRTITYYE